MSGAVGPALRAHLERHSGRSRALVGLFALLVGTYAAWLGGDYGLGLGSLVGFALVAAVMLLRAPAGRGVVARGCYLLAALVLVTPVFLNLPVLTAAHPGVADPASLVLHPGVYVLALVFAVLAAVIAGLGALVGRR